MNSVKDGVSTVRRLGVWKFLCSLTFFPLLLWQFYVQRKINRVRKLQDKVVLITGASSGLGEALAHAFYSVGCRVILASRRKNELERVKETLMVTHPTRPTHPPVVMTLDVSDISQISQFATKALAIHGHIDILVNNAGMSMRGSVLDTSFDVDMKLMMTNYFGQVVLTKAVLPSMVERKSGHIVMVSSVQGLFAIPFRSAYAASKHALQAFSDTLRAEVAGEGVKVTVASPGYIKTALSLNALTGSGRAYGRMDASTAKGYTSEYVADQILYAVVDEKKEVVVAPLAPRLAIFLRSLIPQLYFWIMQIRAGQSSEEGAAANQ